jgi:hypothetical protein
MDKLLAWHYGHEAKQVTPERPLGFIIVLLKFTPFRMVMDEWPELWSLWFLSGPNSFLWW